MGADMVGFLVKGPRKLDKLKWKEAYDFATAITQTLKDCMDAPEWDELDYDDAVSRVLAAGSTRLTPQGQSVLKELITQSEGLQDIEDIEDIAALDPREVVDNLYSVWNEGEARDLMNRLDPDDKSKLIVSVGEMSWGDEPGGFGYETLRDAERLGLWNIFGIY